MGSNLSQVLIDNTGFSDMNAGASDFNSLVGTPSTVECGVFDVRGQAFIDAAWWTSTVDIDTSDADDTTVDAITLSGALWKYSHLQLVQGISGGNSIATPIIPTSAIRSVAFQPCVPTTLSAVHFDGLSDANSAKDYAFRFVVRTSPIAYSNSANNVPSGIKDLSGGGFDFPLGAFNTTNHKVITITVEAAEHAAANIEDVGDVLKTKIEAHGILHKLVTVTKASTGTTADFTMTARHPHVEIDLAIENTTDEVKAACDATDAVGFDAGSGNDWQVLSDEMRCRGRYGNFNRMHFPQDQTQYTVENYKYDLITVSYETPNWPNGAGIAPAGSMNTVKFYFGDSSTELVHGDTEADKLLGIATSAYGTAREWYF